MGAQSTSILYEPLENCARYYTFRGEKKAIDPGHRPDAEGLRPILKTNKEAEERLNRYQSGLKRPAWLTVTASAGFATLLAGYIVAPRITTTPTQSKNMRYAFFGTGLLLALGSYGYSQYLVGSNEKNLQEAVKIYNDSAPADRKVILGFTVDPSRKEGQVLAEVAL